MVAPRHPQWRDSNTGNKYPFEDTALLVNSAGRAIDMDTFIDAAIYPAGGAPGMYISSVDVRADRITIHIGDSVVDQLCSCTFSPTEPTEELRIVDAFGRNAGVLLALPVNLSIFSAWGAGVHTFLPDQTGFVAACCYPVPADMVTGFRLDDGSVLYGDVLLVGEDGIALSCDSTTEFPPCGTTLPQLNVIRVHALGDPLWRRKKCAPGFFDTPRFIRNIVFQKGPVSVPVGPGADGNVVVMHAPILIDDSVIRVRTSPQGVTFEIVGESLDNLG